ncbi:T9SS type A sorting domain-containing protein [Flavobacteriales bacterium]|nr:T9SS type A sorting domain-containing protein [Flavobacteriales bacterium]
MKKILLLMLLALMVTINSNAQFMQNDDNKHATEEFKNPEKSTFTGWYNYGAEIYSLGGTCPYYRSVLFPDSTVLREYSSGMGSVWQHSIGQVLDPTSSNHEFNGNVVFNENSTYTLDSVGIFYRYWKHQQGAPDTLIMQIFDDSKITYSFDPWGSGVSYATVDYDYTTRVGANPTIQQVYILDNNDTISTGQNFIQFPVNMNVAAGEKVAVTFTYIPGNSFNVGDTIDHYMAVAPANEINAFYYFYYVDEDINPEVDFYNNQLLATTSIRYNNSINGWNGSYIPGTSWNSGTYHSDVSFLITSNNVGVEEKNNELQSAVIFPNPVQNIATIEMNLEHQTDVGIELFDMNGKKLMTFSTQKFNEGTNQFKINTEDLSLGVYYCKLTSVDSQSTITFVKIK